MSGSDPFERAARVAAGVASADDLRWLQAGFHAWQCAGGAVPLDRCLALSGPQRGRLALRDSLLDELAGAVALQPGEGPATAMLRELRRFERDTWPRWAPLVTAPVGASYLERILHDLFALRVGVPRTARGLRMRLARKRSEANASDLRHDDRRTA